MLETKCLCGNQAQLRFKDEIGRVIDKVVTIKNVPVFLCPDCKEEFMKGPDSLRFAERVIEAVEIGVEELEF
ncbi:YgiT-type zinc finger protein [Paenibacillus cellulositrophicus]|uniref:YgiT-type zinc finger protein n=1 Tax=Paenibacillus cellulositrophicus TaxID=562959 RepID=UPI00203E65D1|nr:YgiT-type zinc finger protein [Paenibacillus cellulositrophicus]MCM2999988.1 YgiT-type zinc finger protein [Paenibacillus cellulositrophicus]